MDKYVYTRICISYRKERNRVKESQTQIRRRKKLYKDIIKIFLLLIVQINIKYISLLGYQQNLYKYHKNIWLKFFLNCCIYKKLLYSKNFLTFSINQEVLKPRTIFIWLVAQLNHLALAKILTRCSIKVGVSNPI